MARASLQPRPHAAFVIEVMCEDHSQWHAMAEEWGRILIELNSAPTALAITIYEWHLAIPINPNPDNPFAKYPTWKRIAVTPWTLERGRG